jgi:hypothetical protein
VLPVSEPMGLDGFGRQDRLNDRGTHTEMPGERPNALVGPDGFGRGGAGRGRDPMGIAASYVRFRPRPGWSTKPPMRSTANRRRHLLTTGLETSSVCWICSFR